MALRDHDSFHYDLSMSNPMDIVVHKNVAVPMRDGIYLATDVYRPATDEPVPVLLARSPYNKDALSLHLYLIPDPLRLAQEGYAVVVQDCRGCFASEGQFQPYTREGTDTVDTINWIRAQPWANGMVGMIGGSYLGLIQWLTLAESPNVVQAVAPFVTADQPYTPWTYQGGAFQLGFLLYWMLGFYIVPELQRRVVQRKARLIDISNAIHALDQIENRYQRIPLVAVPEIAQLAPFYQDWLAHPQFDRFWQTVAPAIDYNRVTIPVLNIGGWYDIFLGGTLRSYQALRQHGGNEIARRPGLIIGPWSHGVWHGYFPEHNFGTFSSTDACDLNGLQLRWFDYWLKGSENGLRDDKPVKLFVMGINQWREEDDWPLPNTTYRKLYLHSGGNANTLHGDGLLTWEPPGDEPPDQYCYDPRDPTPTCGGATLFPGALSAVNAGPRDQRQVELRPDVLVYSSPPLEQPLEVIGPVRLVLFVASSAHDTDFTGKLVDVFPDGRAIILTDGILRARYRSDPPALLNPGTVYELNIDLVATATTFLPGHRIRLEVASSNFPRFDRHTNTGGTIATETEADWMVAMNRVFHDRDRPSHLILPVINRKAG